MFFCNASSTTVSLGSFRIPMKPSGVTEYEMYIQIYMAMPPSKPARKIRFIKSPLVANCDALSLPEVSATKSRGSTESLARNGAFDGRLRQHYENITTYAVAFPSLALASEQ